MTTIRVILTAEGKQYDVVFDSAIDKNKKFTASAGDAAAAARGLGTATDSAAGSTNRLAGAVSQSQSAIRSDIEGLRVKTALLNALTEVERVQRLTEIGYYGAASELQRKQLMDLAVELDMRRKIAAEQAAVKEAGFLGFGGMGGAGALLAGAGAFAALRGTQAISAANIEYQRYERTLTAVNVTQEATRAEMAFVERQADRLGLKINATGKTWGSFEAALKGTRLEGEKGRDLYLAIGETAQTLNLSADATSGALLAVQQILSKGMITAEDYRGQFAERIPGAMAILARAAGVAQEDLSKMFEQGQLGIDVLENLGGELRRTFNIETGQRINSNAADFARLRNEISLLAAGIGGPLNAALAAASRAAAGGLTLLRGGTSPLDSGEVDLGAGYSRQGDRYFFREAGSIPRNVTSAEEQMLIASQLQPAAPFRDFSSSLTARLTGNLVPTPSRSPEFGAQFAGGKQSDEAAKLREEYDLLKLQTNEQKALYLVTQGRYAMADNATKNYVLALGRERDAQEAATKAATEGRKDDRSAERDRDQLRTQLARNAALEQEVATGQPLGENAKRLLDLQYQTADVSGRNLQDEIKKAVALEDQVKATRDRQKELQALIKLEEDQRKDEQRRNDQAAQSTYDSLTKPRQQLRGVFGRQTTFGGINATETEGVDVAKQMRDKQLADLDAGNLKPGQDKHAAELAAWKAYEDTKTEIHRSAEQARHDLTEQYLQAGSNALGDAAEFASSLGKSGFAAYKELAIAQAVISTYISAQKAAESLYNVPYVGPALAVSAAAAAVGAGMARVGAIRAQEYQSPAMPGRERGGSFMSAGLYPIVERKPELVESGGNFYLATNGSSGRVTPARDLGAGGGLNITYVDRAGVSVSHRRMSDGSILATIDERVEQGLQRARADRMRDIRDRGPEMRMMERSQGTAPRVRTY